MNKRILNDFLKAGIMNKRILNLKKEKLHFHGTDIGTPQGGVISAIIGNTVLDGLSNSATEVKVVRYADDFIVLGKTKEQLDKPKNNWINQRTTG